MALTPSNMIPLGTQAPDFCLQDAVTEQWLSLQELRRKGTVVMFICNHCPFVQHLQAGLVELVKEYQAREIAFIAINSNDIMAYPEDSPLNMKKEAQAWDYTFPYLFDETQEVAKAYRAACTPDFYLFEQDLKCVYRGQFDDSRPNNGVPVTGKDLRAALDALLAGQPLNPQQKPSVGCNIKWR